MSGNDGRDGETPHTQTGTAAMTADQPRLRVLAGSPTDAELAAVHAVIAATLAEQADRGVERVEPPLDQWSARSQAMRTPLAPGPGAWSAMRGMRGR